ncbi:MAG: helix-turn-helix transcriptional regulator [Flavobacteriales bacterium]|nr:MAG: helix-turn-helix transcriptional regulator [Flavobacteriales bacterium]
MKAISIEQFYADVPPLTNGRSTASGPQPFQVYDMAEVLQRKEGKPPMTYDRRAYYKVSLIIGRNRVEYADKVIDVEDRALLFATPKVPYRYVQQGGDQAGHFCIFTHEFLFQNGRGIMPDALPFLQPGAFPVLRLTPEEAEEVRMIFEKMKREQVSDYAYKEDLLRTYLMELIHWGQKLRPMAATPVVHTAAERVSALFTELLERQFPIEHRHQRLELRTPSDFAARLSVHVNHLNKVLNGTNGVPTTDLINARVVQEAKILLKRSDWTVSEIAFALGFQEVSHFSNFFKKHTSISPSAYRA